MATPRTEALHTICMGYPHQLALAGVLALRRGLDVHASALLPLTSQPSRVYHGCFRGLEFGGLESGFALKLDSRVAGSAQ